MCISNLVIKLKPEEIPEFLRGKFFELVNLGDEGEFEENGEPVMLGWVHIREDGTIEFGEPGV